MVTFLAPVWLLALLPWVGVTAWALLSRGRRADVPFVELWRGAEVVPRPRRKVRRPPGWVVAVLVASLLAVLGAAGPVVNHSLVPDGATVVVDRGITMSVKVGTLPRYVVLIDRMRTNLDRLTRAGAEYVVVPQVLVSVQTLDTVRESSPTAVDTRDELRRAIRQALATRGGPVVVLSDAPEGELTDARVVWIRPDARPRDVGIERFTLTDGPRPQVLVRLRNESDAEDVTLTVRDEAWSTERLVHLPTRGRTLDVFVDVPATTGVLRALIDPTDDLPANDQAFLTAGQVMPEIEARSALPPEVARMIDVYRRSRETAERLRGGPTVSTDGLVVVDSLFRLPAGVRGVAVLAQVPDVKPIDATAPVSVEDHALTRDIDWRAAAVGARAPGPPGDGWLPLVSARGGVLLAVRESPVRQVWVGLVSDAFARTPDFVILWTRTFDWLGGGASTFTSQPVGSIGSDEVVPQDAALWPGLVRTRTGRLVALNAAPVNLAESVTTDARETQARINAVAPVDRWSVELRVALLLSSLGVLMFAWRSEVRSERRSLQFRARSES